MGIFKEAFCAECDQKIGFFSRTRIGDDSCLCPSCIACVPYYMYNSVCQQYTLADFRGLKNYLATTNQELKPLFNRQYTFHSLALDSEHKIFCIGNEYSDDTVFLKLEDIEEFDIVFTADEYEKGLVGGKMTGKILFQIKYEYPYFYYEGVLAKRAKSKAKEAFFGNRVEYQNPKGMDDFLTHFLMAQNRALEDKFTRLQEEDDSYVYETHSSAHSADEISKALALFLFDDISEVTMTALREQRNRLMKTYHPDAGSEEDKKYAQKINQAYELLKKQLTS